MSSQRSQRQPPQLILGCSNFGSPTDPFCRITSPEQAASILRTFASYGHHTIDTSRRYPPQAPGTSEEVLGQALKLLPSSADGGLSIHIDTKTLSLPGDHKPENLRASITASLGALGVSSVNTIYLHFPDPSVPLSDPISTLSHGVSSGLAKQWGVSNYTVSDLQAILTLCAQNNWIPPAIYQGEYNALNRQNESLIDFCHENGISFYAYSPAAAGVFSPSGSRLSASAPAGERARALYGREDKQSPVQRVRDVAKSKGLGGHEVAIRWAFWDGTLDGAKGDGVVIGVSSGKQLQETCEFLQKGGLDSELEEVVNSMWEAVKE